MDINATLFGQFITFAVFVWFTMRFVWPPVTKAMKERQKQISDGLTAAEQGERNLELSRHKSADIIQEAKIEAAHIVEQANQRSIRLIEEAKEVARQEGHRLVEGAKTEIDTQFNQAKVTLQNQTASLALRMAEKIIQNTIDSNTHQQLLDELVTEIEA